MSTRDRFYTLTASCPDQVGIIARVTGFIAEHQGWILESSFHADSLDGRYFGPIPTSSIIGRAMPVWTDEDDSGHFEWRAQTR